MEVREVLYREGRDAKNLLVYQFCEKASEEGSNLEKVPTTTFRKPPVAPPKSPNSMAPYALKKSRTVSKQTNGPRVRSASTGRDKKSELQARYWALLFGNLQRAVNEIYQTVESYENISSCQEAILVLENYVREFKALSEWFKVSYDYESKPLQQRPLSLAWEVRKSNPVPRVRAKSLSSPTVSGKSSPSGLPNCSGKSSPLYGGENVSPQKSVIPKGAVRINVRDLLSGAKRQTNERSAPSSDSKNEVEVKEEPCVEGRCHQFAQTDLEDDHLTLADILEKFRIEEEQKLLLAKKLEQSSFVEVAVPVMEIDEPTLPIADPVEATSKISEPTAVEMTVQKLNAMENELLLKDASKEPTPPTTELKKVEIADSASVESSVELKKPQSSSANVTQSPLKYSSVLNRAPTMRVNSKPATLRPTSQLSTATKVSGVPKMSTQPNIRRPTGGVNSVKPVTIRSSSRNPNNSTAQRSTGKIETQGGLPCNVASRLSARSTTLMDIKSNAAAKSKGLSGSVQTARTSTIMSSRKSSREDVGSSSSTLKASNERISASRNSLNRTVSGEERHSEPKQLPSEANDGWLTVKNRRRSSVHWVNRFNQPTGYASLPTLMLLGETTNDKEIVLTNNSEIDDKELKQDSNSTTHTKKEKGQKPEKPIDKSIKPSNLRPEIKNAKAKVNSFLTQNKTSSSQAQTMQKQNSASSATRTVAVPSRQNIIKRQKSDLTGLKMTSLHKEYMRSEKNAQRKQNQQTKDCAKNSINTENGNEDSEYGEHNKIDIKIQTNRDFSKTIGDLYESISLTSKIVLTNGNSTLYSCDENDEVLANEMDCDEDQRMLVEEQESLERQIRELESTEIDVDTETDETDGEVVLDMEKEQNDIVVNRGLGDVFVIVNDDKSDLSLELRYQALLSEMSRGEREEALATLQAYVSRHPGRAQELHQKLSSPSRRRSLQETLKKYQAKQARAQQKRELLQKEKAIKIQQLLARVEDVKVAKWQLIEDKRLKMEERLQRATENREQYLKQIVEKAHDEEKKLKEINFIKKFEAQNKRLDLMESFKETEGRLQDLEQERQKRLEEKAAKEAAVERRRQELEKERQRKLEKMNESRIEKEQRIGKMQEQKERERQALAREKARDREERLLALQVQQQQTTEELQRKILQKQKESARRHEENIEHIRQRALEMTIPLRNIDENGQTRMSNGEENTGEDGDLSSTVSDVGSREQSRGYKKKMKKLKQRMAQSAEEYMQEIQVLPTYLKRDSQVPKYLNLITKGGGVQGLERALGQLQRLLAKAQITDFQCFYLLDGLGIICNNVISKGMEVGSEVSKKAVVQAVQLYRNACSFCPQIARHAILANSIPTLFDALFQSLQLPEDKSPQHPVELSTELMLACTVALTPSQAKKHTHPKVLERLPDLLSYAVITGLIEILSRRCMKIRESVENHQSVILSLLATLGILTRFVDICPAGPTDTTRFLSAAKSTELFGTISMLYASVVPIGECIPLRTVSLTASSLNLLVSMGMLDLATFQEVLSNETLKLKFLDVVTLLLKYCGPKQASVQNQETIAVVIDLIATIGFFCVNNKKNQDLLTSEQCAVILKTLPKLPDHFDLVVYPCLVTITHGNEKARNVLGREFNLDLLDEYFKSDKAKKNQLIALLKEKT